MQSSTKSGFTDDLFTTNIEQPDSQQTKDWKQHDLFVLRDRIKDSQQHDAVITFLQHLQEIIQNAYVDLEVQLIH